MEPYYRRTAIEGTPYTADLALTTDPDAGANLFEVPIGDPRSIEAWNEEAAVCRRRLLEADLAGGVVHELRLTVPNRPGLLAQVTLALGRAGVNIVDLALAPAPDMRSGAITLWIGGDEQTERARALIGDLGIPVADA